MTEPSAPSGPSNADPSKDARWSARWWAKTGAGAGALVLATAAAVGLANGQIPGLVAPVDEPVASAESWVREYLPPGRRLVTDDAVARRMIGSGYLRHNVVTVGPVDSVVSDAAAPDGWREWNYVLSTESVRSLADSYPGVESALVNSVVLAAFGSAQQRVKVRRIVPEGIHDAEGRAHSAAQARANAGEQLLANPRLTASGSAEADLLAGRVDERILLALGQKLGTDRVTVEAFPPLPGEEAADRRQVLIAAVGGRYLTEDREKEDDTVDWFDGLTGVVDARTVRVTDNGVLVTFSIEMPDALRPASGD